MSEKTEFSCLRPLFFKKAFAVRSRMKAQANALLSIRFTIISQLYKQRHLSAAGKQLSPFLKKSAALRGIFAKKSVNRNSVESRRQGIQGEGCYYHQVGRALHDDGRHAESDNNIRTAARDIHPARQLYISSKYTASPPTNSLTATERYSTSMPTHTTSKPSPDCRNR